MSDKLNNNITQKGCNKHTGKKMNTKCRIGIAYLFIVLFFGAAQNAVSGEFSDDIKIADQKLILEQYKEAEAIYLKIIKSSDYSVVEAYAHYKLGSLYKRQMKLAKAKKEYEMGLHSLKEAGESNHQIGKYLVKALKFHS